MGNIIRILNAGNGVEIYDLGIGSRFDVSHIKGYESFTVDNFFLQTYTGASDNHQYLYDSQDRTFDIYGNSGDKNYDKATGIFKLKHWLRLKCGGKVSEANGGNAHVYLITNLEKIKSGGG